MFVSKNFHSKYATCVRTFCKKLPSELQVTTDEIDTYFRSCAQYLWSQSTQPNDIFDGINKLYTDSQVKFTRQEFEDQINFYRANPGKTVGVPNFFLRMLILSTKKLTIPFHVAIIWTDTGKIQPGGRTHVEKRPPPSGRQNEKIDNDQGGQLWLDYRKKSRGEEPSPSSPTPTRVKRR